MGISCRSLLHLVITNRFYISFLQILSIFHSYRPPYQQLRIAPGYDRKICRRLKIIGHPNEIDEHANVNGDCGLVAKFHPCTISLRWPITENDIQPLRTLMKHPDSGSFRQTAVVNRRIQFQYKLGQFGLIHSVNAFGSSDYNDNLEATWVSGLMAISILITVHHSLFTIHCSPFTVTDSLLQAVYES